MLINFESKNLLKHMKGTAIKPQSPKMFPTNYTPTDEEEAKVKKAG